MSEALPFKTTMNFAYGEPRQLAPGIVRIVANNPNHFTFKGTNTYLVGSRTLALIDPGPDDEAHLAAILRAAGGRAISHILITHTHHDHVDGLPALRAATAAKTAGYGHKARRPGPQRRGRRIRRARLRSRRAAQAFRPPRRRWLVVPGGVHARPRPGPSVLCARGQGDLVFR